MVRAVWAATAGILMIVLSACSAGQVTQTATQARDKTGGFGQVGELTIRQVHLAYPPSGVYRPEDQVELRMTIVNSGTVDDRLIGVTGPDFRAAVVGESPPVSADASVASGPIPIPTPPAPLGSPEPDADAPGSTTSTVDVHIPARGVVFVGTDGDPTVLLTDVTRDVDAAQSIEVTLTFARAGSTTVTAIVGSPPDVLPRGPASRF